MDLRIHFPKGDVITHEPYGDCVCGPASSFAETAPGQLAIVITHHALDSRESVPEFPRTND